MKALNGYRATHKNKWLFIQHRVLKLEQLALLEYYADIFDFDKRHSGFGLFKVDFEEIAARFNRKSDQTVRNWHKRLLKLGFIKATTEGKVFELACPLRYINPGKWEGKASEYEELEKDQPIEIILQSFGIDFQSVGKKVQSVGKNPLSLATKLTPIALGSSKDESSIKKKVVVIKQKLRTDEEYQKIEKEFGYNTLETDDMKWIDKNLEERIEVTDETEEEIVRLYFDNNFGEYQKHLIWR